MFGTIFNASDVRLRNIFNCVLLSRDTSPRDFSIMTLDTGDIFDNGLAGGRVGVFTFSQERAIWSQLKYICKEE